MGKRKRKLDVKSIREKLGLTQPDLAETLGCSVRAVQYWENGSHKPCSHIAEKIELLTTQKRKVAGGDDS